MDEKKLLDAFQNAKEAKESWVKQAIEDFNFVVGDQWESKDLQTLKEAGKIALTLNKIQALIFLISGIQRQNRTDFKAFPVGEEDSIKAEAVTYLLKDMIRHCDGDYKQSEQFEDGIICGEGWLEPFIDYKNDLINGDTQIKKRAPIYVYPDPAAKEYDGSDCRYIFVETPNISKEMLLQLFPEKEKEIGEISMDNSFDPLNEEGGKTIVETEKGYPGINDPGANDDVSNNYGKLPYCLIEAHYYKQEKVYIVVDKMAMENEEGHFIAQTEKERDAFIDRIIIEKGAGLDESMHKDLYEVVHRFVPVPRIKVFVNETEIDDFVSPFYPRYKRIPLFSFYAHWINMPIKKRELSVQGIVNSLKDPQREINKRRSQELHHLNSSTNSGWLSKEKEGIVNENEVRKYGSSSGFILKYKKEKPERIFPMALSSGHERLALLANNDIKEISGINTDLLASNDKASSSGRAIHLRQQQGLMMIQRILDNFARTQRELGRFLISQIGQVYDIEKAKRAIGESWIHNKFSVPVMVPKKNPISGEPEFDVNGQPEMVPMLDENKQMKMELDEEAVQAFFKMILEEADLDRYDIVVGSVATSETIKLANYTMMMEFMQAGIPIPPSVLIEESMLTGDIKERIKKAAMMPAK